MSVVCERPLIEILPVNEHEDRLDLHFYKPGLIQVAHELKNIPNLVYLSTLLDESASISSGSTPEGGKYEESGIPFLRVQNIRPMMLRLSEVVFIDERVNNSLARSQVVNGDVLLTITGATFGQAAVFRSNEYRNANVNQHIVRLRFNNEKIIPEFLALFLNSKHGYGQSMRNITGGSRPALDFGTVANLLVPCISKPRQERCYIGYQKATEIAKGVNRVSILIEKKLNNLSDQLQEIFNSIGISSQHNSNNLVRIVDKSDLQDRLDWKTYNPSLIADEKRLSKYFSSSIPVSQVASLNETYKSPATFGDVDVKLIKVRLYGNGAELRELKPVHDISGPIAVAKSGNLILSRIDCTQGAIAILPEELDAGVVSKEFFLLDVDESKYSKELLLRILLHKRYVQYLLSYRTGATNRLRLDKEVLLALPLPDLSVAEQSILLEKIYAIESKIQHLKRLSALAEDQSIMIMQKAMADVLSLSEDEFLKNLESIASVFREELVQKVSEALQ